jgi:hypothetical protein
MCEGADNPSGIKLGTEAMASYHLHHHFYTPFAKAFFSERPSGWFGESSQANNE